MSLGSSDKPQPTVVTIDINMLGQLKNWYVCVGPIDWGLMSIWISGGMNIYVSVYCISLCSGGVKRRPETLTPRPQPYSPTPKIYLCNICKLSASNWKLSWIDHCFMIIFSYSYKRFMTLCSMVYKWCSIISHCIRLLCCSCVVSA